MTKKIHKKVGFFKGKNTHLVENDFKKTCWHKKWPSKPAKMGLFGEESSQKWRTQWTTFKKNTLQNTIICKDLKEGLKVFEI